MNTHSTGAPERVVLDTNTVLALWMFRDPTLSLLRDALDEGRLQPLSREDALEELRRVLAYRQFAQAEADQLKLLEGYRARCELVDATRQAPADLPLCRDTDDQKFIEIAVLGGAQRLLSRDKAVLRLGRHRRLRDALQIQTPEAWLHASAPQA